jgi:hypothetical protein
MKNAAVTPRTHLANTHLLEPFGWNRMNLRRFGPCARVPKSWNFA